MTIEQQLQDFAKNPVAGGVAWDYYFEGPIIAECIAIEGFELRVSYYAKDRYKVTCDFGLYEVKATTIREACEEAVQLVKARAKEIYEALGGENPNAMHLISPLNH